VLEEVIIFGGALSMDGATVDKQALSNYVMSVRWSAAFAFISRFALRVLLVFCSVKQSAKGVILPAVTGDICDLN
jgi:hypothetical protein